MQLFLEERVGLDTYTRWVIDMQSDFCQSVDTFARFSIDLGPSQSMVQDLAFLFEGARAAGMPVIYTVNSHDDWTKTQTWKQ